MESILNSVGARMITRVEVSSPIIPVVPLMPANSADIVNGPGVRKSSTVIVAVMVPLESVSPVVSRFPST